MKKITLIIFTILLTINCKAQKDTYWIYEFDIQNDNSILYNEGSGQSFLKQTKDSLFYISSDNGDLLENNSNDFKTQFLAKYTNDGDSIKFSTSANYFEGVVKNDTLKLKDADGNISLFKKIINTKPIDKNILEKTLYNNIFIVNLKDFVSYSTDKSIKISFVNQITSSDKTKLYCKIIKIDNIYFLIMDIQIPRIYQILELNTEELILLGDKSLNFKILK